MRNIIKGKLGDIVFQFNPSTMTYSGGANWGSISSPGMTNPISFYTGGKPKKFSFTLYINKQAFRDVNMTNVVTLLMNYRDSKKPVLFAYGSFVCYVVVIDADLNLLAWDNLLSISELEVPLTLRAV